MTIQSKHHGLTMIELLIATAALALVAIISLPVIGQMRGDDWALVTREHMRTYANAHAYYVADNRVLPCLGNAASGNYGNVYVTEVGLFDSDAAPVDPITMLLMNGLVDGYVDDPVIFTSPADPLVRYTDTGREDDHGGRFGHFLLPSEDAQAVGATFSRLWFNPGSSRPADYCDVSRNVFVTVGGMTEMRCMTFLRADTLREPAHCADLIEEDEVSRLDNSVFVAEHHIPPPFEPGTSNVIADRHPGEGGHVAFHDGHVELMTNIVEHYWEQEDYLQRVRLLWRTTLQLGRGMQPPGDAVR
ncbi:MAG: prepilin-type N-terminal cleavage/methylation domain-containing protein [Phycisphaerales bacterium]|nr:prepilin-type N-terminal cleavage/methylation domain-containing protein [Phycisphaerales bacterium]